MQTQLIVPKGQTIRFNKNNIRKFLNALQQKYNLQSPDDWNSITRKQIQSNGGSGLLNKFSIYELKCMACPEGKPFFINPNKPPGYWENKENVYKFLEEIKNQHNLTSPEDWNSITTKTIQSHGGNTLLRKYSMYELKTMICPEGKLFFNTPSGYWENNENVHKFLHELKQKYNLNSPKDWNSISTKQIKSNGGNALLRKYSLFELKNLACPEGKSIFDNQIKPSGYWEKNENVHNFLDELKQKYNLNTPEDWNSITVFQIKSHNGSALLGKYSIFQLKCMACPEGKLIFNNPPKPSKHWENKENVLQFLEELKQTYNLKTPEDWNSISTKHIKSHGAWGLLKIYSMYELKCMACPEGKSIFNNQSKPSGYWENKENVLKFLSEIKQKYNLNDPKDWNSVTTKVIQSFGGHSLMGKYSMFELKCMICPEGKSLFSEQYNSKKYNTLEYWENETNRNLFFEKLKHKYNLKTPNDWKRLSKSQIISQGGNWLFKRNKNLSNIQIKFESSDKNNPESLALNELISETLGKRSSQRYLFLQVQKLFPGEEIVEDYFHSEISRDSGFVVQFDVFLIQRKIAIEYHGRHHYEDIPQAFSNLETYKNRDIEKEKLCQKHGIQLIVIPYWWDNNLNSLKETLKLKMDM